MIRLFVALAVPESIQQRLYAQRGKLANARWVPPENYHLTLRFIGEVEPPVAEEIAEVLSNIHSHPIEICLEGWGWFGRGQKLRNLHVLARRTDSLRHLQQKIERALQQMGMTPESRKFTPHITLARLKRGDIETVRLYCEKHPLPPGLSFTAESFTLYSSRTHPNGAVHTPEVTYSLWIK